MTYRLVSRLSYLTGVSNISIKSNASIFNPNAKTNDDAMNECDALVSMRTLAQELNTRKVPRPIEVSNCCSCSHAGPDGLAADVIA